MRQKYMSPKKKTEREAAATAAEPRLTVIGIGLRVFDTGAAEHTKVAKCIKMRLR